MPPDANDAPLSYPVTRTDDQVDVYHGTPVPDPYRWLEDDTSEETGAWVAAQNTVTFGYLDRIPWRPDLRDRLTRLVNYPRESQPEQRGRWYLFARNDGLQNQAVWYLQYGEAGTPEVLLDPNVMSADGTTRVSNLVFNRDGTRIAYMRSEAGSDWQQIRVLDTTTREHLGDDVQWVKVSGIAWHADGFFYSRYPVPDDVASAYSSKNENHQVYYHRLGSEQADDRLVYEDTVRQQRFHTIATTEDEHLAALYVSDRGAGKDGNALYVQDLTLGGPFVPVWEAFDDDLRVVDSDGNTLIVFTNRHAPNGRVVRIDLANPAEERWVTLIAERQDPVESVTTGGGRIVVTYLKDVTTRAFVFAYDGTPEREIVLPGLGSAVGFGGEREDTSMFYTFVSFTAPPTVYRYEIATGISSTFRAPSLPFDPSRFETQQVFVPSKDGTRIPAFIVAKKGVVLDGNNPTLLYGYGGFNVSLPPSFSALRIGFLEQGGVYVQSNLRGGAEYGEAWHQSGMKEKKQNVFDDFIAVAEWLVAERYTSHARLALQGGSNGGLLVAAVVNQRPDIARVALPSVGVMDMLRFHKFTIGWNWIADYGSSDSPDGFAYLYAYSPLHNLHDGTAYPAIMVTTGDHDDRVVPAHSFKYAARLQAVHAGSNPALIRIETQSGHGSSSLGKSIAETADVFAFLLHNMGVTPRFPLPDHE